MHGDGANLVGGELLHQPVGAALGADEDQGAATLRVAELADQSVELRLVAEVDEAVLDLGVLLHLRLVDVAARAAGVGGGEIPGRSLERRREEERLAIAGHLADDPVDRGLEAHVEHPVGLVEDEDPDLLQGDVAALDQVLEAAGSGDDDVRLAGALDLGGEADSAIDGGHPQRPRMGDGRMSSTICSASSRVGARIRAAWRGPLESSRSTIGTPKASVLPEPVGDWTRTSSPLRTSAIASL